MCFSGDGTNGTDSSNSTTEKNSASVKQEKKPKVEILKEEISKKESVVDLQDIGGSTLETAQKR